MSRKPTPRPETVDEKIAKLAGGEIVDVLPVVLDDELDLGVPLDEHE